MDDYKIAIYMPLHGGWNLQGTGYISEEVARINAEVALQDKDVKYALVVKPIVMFGKTEHVEEVDF